MNIEHAILRSLATVVSIVGLAMLIGALSNNTGVGGLGAVLLVTGILGSLVASFSQKEGNMMQVTKRDSTSDLHSGGKAA